MERFTKLCVLGWTCAAVCLEIVFLQSGWPALPAIAAVAFGLAFVATAFDRRAIGVVLVFTYAFPVIIQAVLGQFFAPFAVVWIAALLGAIMPAGLTGRWRLSSRWRAALVCWALTVAVGATIVVAREFDFNSPFVDLGNISNSSIGGWPSYVATWTLHVAIVNVVGILWFDWLSDLSERDFRRIVLVPLGVSCAAMLAVAIYQLLIDVAFLNPTVYASLGRATGTVLDANVCAAVAALWIGGSFLLTATGRGWWRYAAASGAVMGWLAVWATGSRTGFAAAIIVTLFGGAASLRGATERRGWTAGWRVVVGGGIVVAALSLLLAQVPLRVVGPLQRVRSTAPDLSIASMAAFAAQMLNRSGYGRMAHDMIGSHPWVGIGPGAFHVMLADYSQAAGLPLLPPDNAQNWFRHQLVEFGLLGSIGCLGWLASFGLFVLKRRAGEPIESSIPRGMLIAFGAISMVGVPSQDVIGGMTFWTAAFWYVSTTGLARDPVVTRRLTWVGVGLALVVYAVPMVAAATTTLRVPVRAQRIGWPYTYGFYPPEPDGAGGEQRWSGRHATAVIEASSRRLSLSVSVDPLGVNRSGHGPGPLQPTDVRVWVDQALVIDQRVTDTRPIERIVAIQGDERRVFIETRVSRTFHSRELGAADNRELGLLTRWRFVPSLPEAPPAASDARSRP